MADESRVQPSGVSRRKVLTAGAGAALLLGNGVGMTRAARAAATEIVNIKSMYGGITQATITQAIAEAKQHFTSSPSDTVILDIDAGRWVLNNTSGATDGVIDLSNINPGSPDGRLIVRGAGQDGPGATILEFDGTAPNLVGRNVFQVTVQSMHMTQTNAAQTNMKVSQGIVRHAGTVGSVFLDIQDGFPTPADIFDATMDTGRYLRAYDNTTITDPHIIDNDVSPSPTNAQIPWGSAEPAPETGHPNQWRVILDNTTQKAGYVDGQLVGIKSKHGGDAYRFITGSDFVFDDVKWTGETRGVFRTNFNNVRISNCTIRRDGPVNGQAPALASPGGGPQLGQPLEDSISGMLVENCTFVAPGDDILACFNAGGIIRNNLFRDSFARFLLVGGTMQWDGLGNQIVRTPIVIQ